MVLANKRKIIKVNNKMKTVSYYYPLGVGGGTTTYGSASPIASDTPSS